jgi:hypothetical protein
MQPVVLLRGRKLPGALAVAKLEPLTQVFEEETDNRCGVERKDLGEEQTAHHGNAERLAQFRLSEQNEKIFELLARAIPHLGGRHGRTNPSSKAIGSAF